VDEIKFSQCGTFQVFFFPISIIQMITCALFTTKYEFTTLKYERSIFHAFENELYVDDLQQKDKPTNLRWSICPSAHLNKKIGIAFL
jgi:hypothetical protein